MSEFDPAALGARLLRPRRERLADACDAVAASRTAREAWETLAARDVIPFEWVGASGRSFRTDEDCRACDGVGLADDAGTPCPVCAKARPPVGRLPHPHTIAGCAAIGSDAAGASVAEALARECAARLRPWGVRAGSSVTWWVIEPRSARKHDGATQNVWSAMRAALDAQRGAFPDPRKVAEQLVAAGPGMHDPLAMAFQRAANNLRDAMRWRYAAVLGLRVPPPAALRNGRPAWPAELAGRSFAELPDPFTPRMRIWLLGYMLDKADAEGVELVALAPLLT